MNTFEQHNIRHLSASSLNLWREQPGLWALRYLAKVKDEMGAAVWRGKAIEAGVEIWLRKRSAEEAMAAAESTFEANAQGEVSDEIDAERAMVAPATEIAIGALQDVPPLLMAQAKIEHWLDGVDVPLIGYVDFIFEDGSLFDLKTTKRIPSEPKPDHARQVGLYMKAREAPGSLLYVSGKKFASHPVPEDSVDTLLAGLRMDALALQEFLGRFETADRAIRSLPMNIDHFMFGDDTRAAALELFA